ncbi:S41 family peptidase [Falsiporphyromonas endometrii]|uniref:S41 family peptidase n=1 Tax=Falsiporphyromonas endometrii TaxID=1387297 RepID=A0ABV9K990_9PORP
MNRRKPILSLFSCIVVILSLSGYLSSCDTEDRYTSNPKENFDALWSELDKGYCYFDIKLPKDSTWRDMYDKYVDSLRPKMSTDSLFRVMTMLIRELKDGHVNLITPFNNGRYWNWKDDYPRNLNIYVRDKYLGHDYSIAAGFKYKKIKYNNHAKDSIALVVYNSFSSPIGEGNINGMLSRLIDCKAIILDIRDNGGGNMNYADKLASHFINKKTLVGYISHKTGPKHDQFSKPYPMYINPVEKGVRWLRPVVLLTDRGVFSAANDFAMRMKDLPLVTIIGDHTGGGAGLPMSTELPNGWGVRYSSSRSFDAKMRDVEFGIAPHYTVMLNKEDEQKDIDNVIEEAISYINNKYEELKRTGFWFK